jgi:transcription antitermination factor NusG
MWSVAQIKPGQLDLALTNLTRQGYGTFNPSFEKRKLDRRRKLAVVNEPLFPGYIFVEILKDQRWVPIRSAYGINKLLTRTAADSEYLEPAFIDADFIGSLRSYSTQKNEREWRLDTGTEVRIERGPFAQMTGTITSWSSPDRCRLLVWMLGRETTVEVRGADVVAAQLHLIVPSR